MSDVELKRSWLHQFICWCTLSTDMPPTHYWCVGWQLNGLVQDGRKWLFRLNFFSFKSAWVDFCMCFYFLVGLHFASEKNEVKILKRAQWMQQIGTRAFQPKKDTGEWFFTKSKSTCKNSGTFEGKKLSKKVPHDRLAPSHSIMYWWCISQHTTIPLAVMPTMHWLTYSYMYCYLQNALVQDNWTSLNIIPDTNVCTLVCTTCIQWATEVLRHFSAALQILPFTPVICIISFP